MPGKTFGRAGKAVAVGAGVIALSLAAAGSASANSFKTPVSVGYVQYEDGKDRFCAFARNNTGKAEAVRVTLTPNDSSRGPTLTVTDYNSWWDHYQHWNPTCSTALSRAYEDTRYTARVRIWTGSRWQYVKSIGFWT